MKYYFAFTLSKCRRLTILVASLGLIFWHSGNAQTNTWDGSSNNNWNTAANWSLNVVPLPAHNVVIPNGATVTVNTAALCNNFTINGGGSTTSVTIAGTNSITATGAVVVNPGTGLAGNDRTFSVGAGTLSCASINMPSPSFFNFNSTTLTVSSGTVNVSGAFTMGSDILTGEVSTVVTGAGRINLAGNISGGNLTMAAASVFNFEGSSAQTVPVSNYTYGNLYLNNSSAAGATLGGTVTGTNVITNLEVQSGIFNNGGYAITLSANDNFVLGANSTFILSGTSAMPTVSNNINDLVIPATSSVKFQGANQSVLGGITYGQLFLEGSGTKTLTDAVTIAGEFELTGPTFMTKTTNQNRTITLLGDFNVNSGTITENGTNSVTFNFAGTSQQMFNSGSGTVTNNINYNVANGAYLQMATPATVVSGAGTFTVQSGGTLGITSSAGIAITGATGNIRVGGTRTYSNGANYIYNGTSPQVTGAGLTQNTPANVTIDAPGTTVSLSANTSISGNLLISNGTFASANNNMTLGGNWTNNGTGFTAGTGSVTINGTGTSTIGGSTVTSFNNLSVTKSSGTAVLGQSVNVAGTLTIGVNLNLASFNLTLGNASPAIVNSGGAFGASRMIIASGGGKLIKSATSAAQASYFFPIGDNSGTTDYSPFTTNFTAVGAAGSIAVGVTDVQHPNNGFTSNMLTRYWTVNHTGLGTFSTTVTVQYTNADVVGTESNLRLGKWNGSEPWVRFTTVPNAANNTISGGPISSFSDFTGLSLNALLPVKLVNFYGTLLDKAAVLEWKTAEEINSSHYDVEYSNDGQYFTTLASINSQNSLMGSSYLYKHLNPAKGNNYYRLKMVDIDGKFDYSPVIQLKYAGVQQLLRAYPNPAVNDVTILFEKAGKNAFIRIVDMQGRLVKNFAVPVGATLQQIKLGGFARGLYNIIYENGAETTMYRVQKN